MNDARLRMSTLRYLAAVRRAAPATTQLLDQWERDFRSAAWADRHAILGKHLRRLGLQSKARAMLEGTIRVVRMSAAYAALDGHTRKVRRFLSTQRYDPAEASNARYTFTFDICGKTHARVLVESKAGIPDLGDLYGTPWFDYEVVGFSGLWIANIDWSPLTSEQMEKLEDRVTSDVRYDYREDEVDLYFDDTADGNYLQVYLQDAEEPE